MTFIRHVSLIWLTTTLTENQFFNLSFVHKDVFSPVILRARKKNDESSTHRMLIAQSTAYATLTHAASNLSKLRVYL